jgi:hypothetical protein
MNASVTQRDATTTIITDGDSAIILKDLDQNAATVDQVAVARQTGEQLYGGTIDSKQTVLVGEWGDPHVRLGAVTGQANANLSAALNALKADAADGKIDDQAAFHRTVSMLADPSRALGTAGLGGQTTEVMDLQADHVLRNGSMTIAVDVEARDKQVAFAENAMFTFADGSKHTITNIWNRSGRDGALGVRAAQAGDGGQSNGTFFVVDAQTMGRVGSTHAYGAAHGSAFKYVLDVEGNFDASIGTVGQVWDRNSAMQGFGLGQVELLDRFQRVEEEKEKEKEREPVRTIP